MDMEGTGGTVPGIQIFNESRKGYIAYGLRDNIRRMENFVRAPMDDLLFLYDPNMNTNVQVIPHESGVVGNDPSNTYFRKDW